MFWLITLLALIFGLIYYWMKQKYSYFEKLGIPYIPPLPFIGNLKPMLFSEKSPIFTFHSFYEHKNAENQPFVGIYLLHKPGLLIRDLELIKRILIKDFNYFSNRGGSPDPQVDAIGAHNLFFVKNPKWKSIRAALSSFFSSAKLKNSSILIQEVGNELDNHIKTLAEKRTPDWDGIEFKELCARYTTDVIATVAFGLNANSIKNPNAEFRAHGAKLFNFTWTRSLEVSLILLLPEVAKLFKAKLFSSESNEFLRSSIGFALQEREKSKIKRNDLIDILLELKNSKKMADENDVKFEGDVLFAQAAFFFAAGFETTSAAVSFSLYNLAMHPEIQKRAREEIQSALKKTNGELTYEAISEMEYLTGIIYESTRLYPVLPFLDRECTPPDGATGYSLKPFSDFVIPKGMTVYISIYSLHMNPEYFPDPHKFDPERFLPKNRANIAASSFLGFGGGPHYCIGERLAVLQSKIGLISILKNHWIQPSKKTPKELVFDKKSTNTQVEGGMYLDIKRDELY